MGGKRLLTDVIIEFSYDSSELFQIFETLRGLSVAKRFIVVEFAEPFLTYRLLKKD